MSTHNICFRAEKRKIMWIYLSRAMSCELQTKITTENRDAGIQIETWAQLFKASLAKQLPVSGQNVN